MVVACDRQPRAAAPAATGVYSRDQSCSRPRLVSAGCLRARRPLWSSHLEACVSGIRGSPRALRTRGWHALPTGPAPPSAAVLVAAKPGRLVQTAVGARSCGTGTGRNARPRQGAFEHCGLRAKDARPSCADPTGACSRRSGARLVHPASGRVLPGTAAFGTRRSDGRYQRQRRFTSAVKVLADALGQARCFRALRPSGRSRSDGRCERSRRFAFAVAAPGCCTWPPARCFRAERPSGREARAVRATGRRSLLQRPTARAAAPSHRQSAFEHGSPCGCHARRDAPPAVGVRLRRQTRAAGWPCHGRALPGAVTLVVTKLGGLCRRLRRFASKSSTHVAGRSVPRAPASSRRVRFAGNAWPCAWLRRGGSREQRSGSLLPPPRNRGLSRDLQTDASSSMRRLVSGPIGLRSGRFGRHDACRVGGLLPARTVTRLSPGTAHGRTPSTGSGLRRRRALCPRALDGSPPATEGACSFPLWVALRSARSA